MRAGTVNGSNATSVNHFDQLNGSKFGRTERRISNISAKYLQ
jgi:hypothetical protein